MALSVQVRDIMYATQGFIFISEEGATFGKIRGGGRCMVVHWYFIEAPTSRCTHTIRPEPNLLIFLAYYSVLQF